MVKYYEIYDKRPLLEESRKVQISSHKRELSVPYGQRSNPEYSSRGSIQITSRSGTKTFKRKSVNSIKTRQIEDSFWNFSNFREQKDKVVKKIQSIFIKPEPKKQLALLLPGHNEELIIATTIKSAIASGQDINDIYVVDDCSSDKTREKAVNLLGEANVLSVSRSGKALAVKKAIKHFDITNKYEWLHIADADSVFGKDYFRIYKSKLSDKYAIALGFVQSLRGNWISNYRAATYTYSQHISRRIQSKLGMISVFPGPITCFKTEILDEIDFEANTLTEDFDITLQVHRKKLGKVLFIPKAINYTQDPQTLKDFIKQNQRWQRGFFQGVKKYRIGLRPKAIDASLGFQMWQAIVYLLQIFVIIPYFIYATGDWMIIPVVLAADFIVASIITILSSAAIKRWTLIGSLPYFYFLRWVEVAIFVWAFIEIYMLKKFRTETKGWGTEGRRYKLDSSALKDVAA